MGVKTVRFANVVAKCGQPEAHLVLTLPAKDRALQGAIKRGRLMTVFQNSAEGRTDHGIVGFEPGKGRQFLIFPKSLHAFENRNVVGIKYELLAAEESSKADHSRVSPRPSKPERKPAPKARIPPEPREKVITFPPAAAAEGPADARIVELKNQVRQAMDVLEQGKQIAAFNLLKRIVED